MAIHAQVHLTERNQVPVSISGLPPGGRLEARDVDVPGSTVAEEPLDVLRLRPLPVLLSPPCPRCPAPVGRYLLHHATSSRDAPERLSERPLIRCA